ncbi:MAG: hypothetical protein WCK59_00690 [Candidatus Falkowbacteria bacterium]
MKRVVSKQVTLATALIISLGFAVASLVPIIGPCLLAYFSGRMYYFIKILTGLEVVLAILFGELIFSVLLFLFWQSILIFVVSLLMNIAPSIILFFIALKMEQQDQTNGLSI